MRKKLASLTMAVSLIAVFAASNMTTVVYAKTNKNVDVNSKAAETSEVKTEADGKVTIDDFAVVVKDVKVEIGKDMNGYTKKVGDPDSMMQANDCLNDREEKVYQYGGIIIYTHPSGKKDIVYSLELTGEEATLSGIHVGSTKEEVVAAYGQDYTEDMSYMTYTPDDISIIEFQMKDDKVINIYMEIDSK